MHADPGAGPPGLSPGILGPRISGAGLAAPHHGRAAGALWVSARTERRSCACAARRYYSRMPRLLRTTDFTSHEVKTRSAHTLLVRSENCCVRRLPPGHFEPPDLLAAAEMRISVQRCTMDSIYNMKSEPRLVPNS